MKRKAQAAVAEPREIEKSEAEWREHLTPQHDARVGLARGRDRRVGVLPTGLRVAEQVERLASAHARIHPGAVVGGVPRAI